MVLNTQKQRILASVFASFFGLIQTVEAHESTPDFLRSMGKMYVVVAIIAVIFIGMVVFMVYMERRIANLEKQIEAEKE